MPEVSAKPKAPKVAKSTPSTLKATLKLPSLDELEASAIEQEQPELTAMKEVSETISQPDVVDTPFNVEALNKQWAEFREQSKKQEKDREVNVLGQPYELDESNWNISVTLSNPVQQDILEHVKPDLTGFLRSTLKNNKLTIEWKMGQIDQTKKLYTSREKFDHLAKHYPLLEDLKDKLGLDPDY